MAQVITQHGGAPCFHTRLAHEMALRVALDGLGQPLYDTLASEVADSGAAAMPLVMDGAAGKVDLLVTDVPASQAGERVLLGRVAARMPAVLALSSTGDDYLSATLLAELSGMGYQLINQPEDKPVLLVSHDLKAETLLFDLLLGEESEAEWLTNENIYEYIVHVCAQAGIEPNALNFFWAICNATLGRMMHECDAGAPYELATYFPLPAQVA